MERLVHIHPHLGTALDVRRAQLPAQLLRLLQRHPSLYVQVGLVAHHQHRKLIAVLDPENLFLEFGHLLEAGVIRQREHQQESFATPHVLLPHRTELLLTGSVQDWNNSEIYFF